MKEIEYSESYDVFLVKLENDFTFNFMLNGSYGLFYKNFILSLNDECVFVDIGANMGLYSLIAAKNKNIKKSYAFEPVPETMLKLIKNIKINKATEKIEAFDVAIGSNEGYETIHTFSNHSGGATMRNKDLIEKLEAANITKVKVKNFKYLDEKINPDCDVHVKIDVEGLEQDVLDQLFKTSWCNKVKSIFIELDSRYGDTSKIIKTLLDNNFVESYNTINKNDDMLESEKHYDALYIKTGDQNE